MYINDRNEQEEEELYAKMFGHYIETLHFKRSADLRGSSDDDVHPIR